MSIVSSSRHFAALLSLIVVLSTTTSFGAIVLNDDFSDNNRLQTGALDANWFKNHTDSTLAAPSGVLQYGPGGEFRGITGTIPTSVTLANIGDLIELSFDFRFTTAPSNLGGGFRFGLYNSNSTPAADNAGTDVGTATTNNDYGYYFNLSTGAPTPNPTHALFRENGGTAGIMAGTDRTQIGANNISAAGITDTDFHAGLLRITRTSLTEVEILAQVDSTVYFNNISTTSLTPSLTFDEVGFGTAARTSPFEFDNVVVTYTPIPEPSSLALIGCGLSAAAWGFMRRKVRG